MIYFKPLTSRELPLLHHWLQVPHVREFWDDDHRKLSQVKRHYLKKDEIMRFIIFINEQAIGYIQRYSIELQHPFWNYIKGSPCVGIDFFIGEAAALGQGWAPQIMTQFIKQYCPAATEILVDPESRNHRAIRFYKKLGFHSISTITQANKTYQLMALERQASLPQRIMVIGRPGSGKSTLALALKTGLHLPLYHLDKYFFLSNWIERDYQEFLTIQQQFVESECWIIDGNSTKSFEVRYSQADTCLYFNFPRWLCYWRVFKRRFSKNPAIDDRAPDCKEIVSRSLLRYMWAYEKRVHFLLNTLKQKYPHVNFIELRTNRDISLLEKNILMLDK